jgi:tetratricopeptide (TPR) repeat protein
MMQKRALIFCLPVLLVVAGSYAVAQDEPNHPGLVLCREHKYAAAILPLENAKKESFYKNNPEVWNCLSLAYLEKNELKNAQKNAEKAAKLDPANSVFHSNLAYIYLLARKNKNAQTEASKAIALNPGNVNAYYFRSTANLRESKLDSAETDAKKTIEFDPANSLGYVLISNIYVARLSKRVQAGSSLKAEVALLKEAMEVLRIGKEKCRDKPDHNLVDEAYETILAFYEHFSRDNQDLSDPASPDPSLTSLKINSKPRPGYTDSARQNNVQGTVILLVLFGANGKIGYILPLKGLGNGLTEQSIAAASKIQFEPAKKDGKSVSTVRVVEYTFSIY